MQEDFLHFIWKFLKFNHKNLCLSNGSALQIRSPGISNNNAGPDFLQAHVLIADIEWHGAVEIHVKSSIWTQHKHDTNKNFDQVILHVVWEDDQPIRNSKSEIIPTLALKGKVDLSLIDNYDILINSGKEIPCISQIDGVRELTKISMLDRVLLERLKEKSDWILDSLNRNEGDWEETTYCLLAKNFGFKINSDMFLELAKSLPFKLLKKHANSLVQLEALMFGQAGFLEKAADDYSAKLVAEYGFLKKKYDLVQHLDEHHWKFLRLRPANFPTRRIAQLASFVHKTREFFSSLIEVESLGTLTNLFDTKVSTYWHEHYHFSKISNSDLRSIGKTSIENLAINTVSPLLWAYGRHINEEVYHERTIRLLKSIKRESNYVIRKYQDIFENESSYESQSLMALHNSYCKEKKCLQCHIGVDIINNL